MTREYKMCVVPALIQATFLDTTICNEAKSKVPLTLLYQSSVFGLFQFVSRVTRTSGKSSTAFESELSGMFREI